MDVLSIGVDPQSGRARLSCLIDGLGFYLDMDSLVLLQIGRRLDYFAETWMDGHLPCSRATRGDAISPTEDLPVNPEVNGAENVVTPTANIGACFGVRCMRTFGP